MKPGALNMHLGENFRLFQLYLGDGGGSRTRAGSRSVDVGCCGGDLTRTRGRGEGRGGPTVRASGVPAACEREQNLGGTLERGRSGMGAWGICGLCSLAVVSWTTRSHRFVPQKAKRQYAGLFCGVATRHRDVPPHIQSSNATSTGCFLWNQNYRLT
jgi:hypothetical protein